MREEEDEEDAWTGEAWERKKIGDFCNRAFFTGTSSIDSASSGLMQEGKAKDIADLLSLSEKAENGEETFKHPERTVVTRSWPEGCTFWFAFTDPLNLLYPTVIHAHLPSTNVLQTAFK